MALVSALEKITRDRHKRHKQVRCTCFTFDQGGNKYIQLDTYGSDERQLQDKMSQSLQFDEAAAKQLLALIKETFPHLSE